MKPGARLIAGLSAFGLAAAFLTGCSDKEPEDTQSKAPVEASQKSSDEEQPKDQAEAPNKDEAGAPQGDADQALCEELTAILHARDLYHVPHDGTLYEELEPEEQAKVGEEFQATAKKYKTSEYAEYAGLRGRYWQKDGEFRADSETNYEEKFRVRDEAFEDRKRVALEKVDVLDDFEDKCEIFAEDPPQK